ncbi:uncharacterized protein Dwil_GK26968 [Drosophila willistoni]|uniref:CHK kinase-like domain-containing protein n=1 Tax=Drosophila willistoni TaxID=7260 RepID=A0A0Q9WRB1_DROWI|nr:uncharacterized protein LOC26528970 [Drosophila willistoni]KRF98755.1 uncharacterized protein Dwil_GK26968 [Drosophila willistoni]
MASAALELSNSDIQGLCQKYLHQDDSTGFDIVSYKMKPTSDAPAGYLGSHFYLQVTLRLHDSNELKHLRFFSKMAPVGNESRMEYLEDFGVFQKEIAVYLHVLPDLQKVSGDVAPKCYYADKNILVFENLADQGYRMGSGRDGLLNYEHLLSCLKTLAALHAGSIIQEKRLGKNLIETHPKVVEENAYPSNKPPEHLRNVNFNNSCEVLKEFVKTIPKYQKKMKYILDNFTPRMSKMFELVKTSKKYQNALLHGDLWANNIMFQYGKYGETPLECRFVDFQLARYAPPASDLMTVLTIPTTSEFREKHMDELLVEYYRFMKEFLKRANLDINDIMPEQQYYESVEEYRILGLIESCLFCHLVMLPPSSTQKLTGSEEGFNDFFSRHRINICMEAFNTDELYRNRLVDMLQDFVDHFILSETN